MHTPRVGDKFRLGEWEWEVREVNEPNTFKAYWNNGDIYRNVTFWFQDTDKLEWLYPPLTISKRLKKEIKKNLSDHVMIIDGGSKNEEMIPIVRGGFFPWLDSLEETE